MDIDRRKLPGRSAVTRHRTQHLVRKGADCQHDPVVGGYADHKVRQQQQCADNPCDACQYQPPPRDMHDGGVRGQGPRLRTGWRYHWCTLVSATIETFQRTLRKTQLYPNACGPVSSVMELSPCTWPCA